MNAHSPVDLVLSDPQSAAINAVNRWRGHCVECYARLEFEVTATLSALAAVEGNNASLPPTFAHKVRRLRASLTAEWAFKHLKLAKALDCFDDHLKRRNMLVHATGKVWSNGKDDWLWSYRFRPAGKGVALEIGCFERDEAIEIENGLARETQSLGDQLRALRRKVEAVTK